MLLKFPEVTHEGADLGVSLFMEALFPYLLPYLILTNWFIRLTSSPQQNSLFLLFKTYAISAIGGFPTGAATIAHLYKRGSFTPKQAAYLLGICHCPSPLFVFGFVGQDVLQSTSFSWKYLILLHIFSLCVLALMYKRVFQKTNNHLVKPLPEEGEPFTNSIRDSVPTILIVAATIIFFTTIYSVFLHSTEWLFPSLPHYFEVIIACALEYTNGLFLLPSQLYGNPLFLAAALILTTQSFSIHLQVIVIARTAKIAIRPYLFIRLLYSIIIPILFALFFL